MAILIGLVIILIFHTSRSVLKMEKTGILQLATGLLIFSVRTLSAHGTLNVIVHTASHCTRYVMA
jgi:hypothetical protein